MGAVEEAASSGETRLIDDAAAADAWKARLSVISLTLRTIVCVPLKTPRGVVGVIYVDSNAITRGFTKKDVPLVEAFAAQAAAAVERLHLQRAVMDRDRMRRSSRIAAEIQRTFLLSRFPELDGVTGALASVPALEVGGDFYDVIRLPGGRVGVLVGDVSGKGVPGALFGARLLSDVRYEALYQDDVGATLTAVNRLVARHSTRGMFVTFLYAVLDPANRCGPVRERRSRAAARAVQGRPPGGVDEAPSGIPLGILPDAQLRGRRAAPRPPGRCCSCSPTVSRTRSRPDGERFGTERLEEVVARGPGDPAALVDALCTATADFTGKPPAGRRPDPARRDAAVARKRVTEEAKRSPEPFPAARPRIVRAGSTDLESLQGLRRNREGLRVRLETEADPGGRARIRGGARLSVRAAAVPQRS